MSIIEVDYHIELSSIRDFVNGYIQSNNVIPFNGHAIFKSMKKAVIGSEIMPFLFAPTDGKPDNYYDKYVRLENEYSLKSIPDFFSHEGNFYDLDKKLNINIYNVDDLIFQQLFSIKMIEIDDKKIKLTDFLNFQLYDNFFGDKEHFANFLRQLLEKDGNSRLFTTIVKEIREWLTSQSLIEKFDQIVVEESTSGVDDEIQAGITDRADNTWETYLNSRRGFQIQGKFSNEEILKFFFYVRRETFN